MGHNKKALPVRVEGVTEVDHYQRPLLNREVYFTLLVFDGREDPEKIVFVWITF